MADQTSLRRIGLSFGAITAVVMLIAAFVVADASRGIGEQAKPLIASAEAGNV